MKGFTKDGKFHPIKPYNKVRKSRDQKVKTEGVRMKRTKDWLDKLNKKQQYQAYLDWSKEREKMYPDEKWELLKKKGLTREKDFKFWKRMEHAIVKGQPEEEGGNIANERKARDEPDEVDEGQQKEWDDDLEETEKSQEEFKKFFAKNKINTTNIKRDKPISEKEKEELR